MKHLDIASLTAMLSVAVPVGIAVVIIAVALFFVWRRRARPLKSVYFQEKWNDIQKLCGHKENWPQVVHQADALLDEALKKCRARGRSMGERLVSVQRKLTDNDGAWFGHKLRNKLEADPSTKLKEVDVKDALIGIRQALKDLGALPGGQTDKNQHDKGNGSNDK